MDILLRLLLSRSSWPLGSHGRRSSTDFKDQGPFLALPELWHPRELRVEQRGVYDFVLQFWK